ncbi:TetR/AcrR family transcriptional regulator [Intestinicryptomonas porci]|uniref:TetR/AcrR family transcriptional regulator n=1 Tax=Intestinicryptomonas porci TaxID=2926320 RepID=A0ABU4WFN1_9BACT|nr:TetR/AcrR family transcriptional regulator [Opitutales bacterium CLA-KB-P66]
MKITREKILEAAFFLMVETGYDDISIGDIQKFLGISRGLLYFYFKNKEDLVFHACRHFFFDGYLTDIDLENITLKDFLIHVVKVEDELLRCGEHTIDILRYNIVYSRAILRDERFKKYSIEEFTKAMMVIRNAKLRGEIKDLSEKFVGATLLSILGRTTYITKTPNGDYVKKRIVEDIWNFYNLIKSDKTPNAY